jgi:AAA family ATP:ADP antiporter
LQAHLEDIVLFNIVLFSQRFSIVLKYLYGVGLLLLFGLWISGYLGRLIKATYGFEDDREQRKFTLLSVCLGFVVGVYWMFRACKEAIFFDLVGAKYLPKAKMITPVITFALLLLFGMVSSRVKKHRIFWVLAFFYGPLFTIIGFCLKFGVELRCACTSWIPGNIIGWIHFFAVESFGGLIISAVFWAFVASTTKTVSAKRGYPMITLGGQIGYLTGPAIVTAFAVSVGNANLILAGAFILFFLPFIMEFYARVVPLYLCEGEDYGRLHRGKTGPWEGLRLLVTKPFLIGIAVVATAYEAISSIIDFQFKTLGSIAYPISEELAAFNAFAAMSTALVSILLALGGTSFFVRVYGVKFCLLVYPVLLGVTIVLLWLSPGLFSFFVAMLVIKALSYTFNTPVKELLYLPTSEDVKMKAKGFIDGFGGKLMKASGSAVNNWLVEDMASLLNHGCLISMSIVGIWIVVAIFVGNSYNRLVDNKDIVE